MMGYMAVILEKDLKRGHDALVQWRAAARELADNTPHRLTVSPVLPRPVWAMAVRYSLFLLERRAPGPGVEVRVAPWGAVKILDGPESDPHNLTPPDVIELDPEVWLRLACGITTWAEEKDGGHIRAGRKGDLHASNPPAAAPPAITTNPLVLNQAQGDYYEKTGVQLFLGLSAEGMGIGIGLRGAGFGAAGAEAGNSPLVAFAAGSGGPLAGPLRSDGRLRQPTWRTRRGHPPA